MSKHPSTRLFLGSVLTLVLFAGLAGCQAPVSVSTPPSKPIPAVDRDAEIARILELKKRGVINDAQVVEILTALVGSGAPGASSSVASSVSQSAPLGAVESTARVERVAPPPAADPRYRPTAVLSGRLRSVGSDTMDLLVANWERRFLRYHSELRVVHEGRGSSTATPALLEGQADFGPMSRALMAPEIKRFRDRFGYDPTQVRVAIDALGIYVHPTNPVVATGLTLEQVDAIFSSTRARGGEARITTWGQLGIGGAWASAPINVYGRNKASGTYGFFRDSALAKGEFGEWVLEQPGSGRVIEQVAADKFGIGYSGVGYKTSGVALAPLVPAGGQDAVEPSEASALDGSYPLARPLFLVFNRDPKFPPSDLQREFLNFVLGPVGQEAVKEEGFYPVPADLIAAEREKLR